MKKYADTRVRMAYGRPLAFVHSYVPARVLDKVPRERLLKQPLTTVIEDRLAIKVAGLKLVVSAKLSDRQVSAHLEIPTGSPVLFVERNYLHKKRLVCVRPASIAAICLATRSRQDAAGHKRRLPKLR